MVVRKGKRNRKYFGTRRWGVGNIKNARGKGSRGGVGRAGARKHKFTHMTAYAPEEIRKVGFTNWNSKKYSVITVGRISDMVSRSAVKDEVELRGYKVLSNGEITVPVKIKAEGFSKQAVEKIRKAGGEAIPLRKP